jgi:hypothetical protein
VSDVGMVKLAEDFGASGGDTPVVDFADLDGKLAEAQAQLGDPPNGLRFQRPAARATKATWVAWSDQVREKAGIAWDYMQQVRDAFPKASPPPVIEPPKPRPTVLGVCGSYAGHDPARDVYLGLSDQQVQWGPHHGFEVRAPAPGSVQALTFPTPLDTWLALGAERRRELERFFADFTCWLPPARDVVVPEAQVDPLQTMYVLAYAPDGGYRTTGGLVRLQVGAHVRQDIRTGRVTTGDLMTVVWDSGIHFESAGNPVARAAHFHSAPSQSGQLLPNGDMDGLYGCELFSWQVQNIGTVPGPNDYAIPNRYCAGRLYSDFQQAGQSIPPMPS